MNQSEIASIDLKNEVAITEDGQILPVFGAWDEFGDDCELQDAVVCGAGPDNNGLFLTVDFRDWVEATMQ